MKNNTVKIALLSLILVINSCNTLKRVEEDELLLVKNTINTNGEKVNDENIKSLLLQKPNSSLLGFPLGLQLYNLAKKNPDSSYQAWLYKKPNRVDRLRKLISQKQLDSLGESFFIKGYSNWLRKTGEAPVVIDTSKAGKSIARIKAYYGNRGYFNARGSYEIDSARHKKQRASLHYNINLGEAFMIDSTYRNIASAAIDSIYLKNRDKSFISTNTQFDLNNLTNERERLTDLFRNNGIYNFQESSIFYNIISDTALAAQDPNLHIELNIDNLKKRGDTSKSEYKPYSFKQVNIYADHLNADVATPLDSLFYSGYTIYFKNQLKYKPKALTDAIFLAKDSLYRDINRVRTYRQINNLNNFKYPNIEIIPDSISQTLNANIYLAARDKYSFNLETDATHSNIQFIGISLTPSLSIRNVFGGAENLSISGRASVGSSRDRTIQDDRFFNVQEYGADINLDFPRIWFPFVNTKQIIPYYMLPQTRLSLGTSFQQNIGLDKQTFNSILGYNWTPKAEKKHSIELLNLQFVRNLNTNRFYNVYINSFERLNDIATQDIYINNPDLSDFYIDQRLSIPRGTELFTEAILSGNIASSTSDFNEIRSIEERRERLSQNNLIFASNYTYFKNSKTSLTDNSFHQFKFKVESAGNFLSLLSNIIPFETQDNELNSKLLISVPYSQYIKTEFDYVKHWEVTSSQVLAFRSFFGIAVPYGNSDNIPFVRSYFGGGSYDNRAWNPYSLGPGRTRNINDFNEANLKIALNFEYRFPVAGNFKGALFADAGNIWNVLDNVDDPDATFNGLSSLQDIALGTGFGVRYDFTYFVFRVDLGFKTYNPAEEMAKRWFRDYNFANSVLQIGINYPF